jgi:hypothetical protein
MPKCRHVRATFREDSPARCSTLNRQTHNRAFALPSSYAPPCRYPLRCANIRQHEDGVEQSFARFEQDEKARRDDAKKRLEAASGERSIKASRRWWKDAEANVDDWVTDFMKNKQQRLGLTADPAAWPKPQALQSIWRFHAYKMARIHPNRRTRRESGARTLPHGRFCGGTRRALRAFVGAATAV